jgi:putative oxidoreductase
LNRSATGRSADRVFLDQAVLRGETAADRPRAVGDAVHDHILNLTLLPLRLIVGFGFMEHGFAKLAKGPDAFANILQAIGVPGPHFMAWSTVLVEIFGGLAVILGAFVTLASLPMAAVLLVAMFTVHLPYGFSSIKLEAVTAAGAQFGPPGYEVSLLYLACLAALVLGGPGPLTIGDLIRKRSRVIASASRPNLTPAA